MQFFGAFVQLCDKQLTMLKELLCFGTNVFFLRISEQKGFLDIKISYRLYPI